MKANMISGPKKRNKAKVSSWSQIPENQWSHRVKRGLERGGPGWAYEHTGQERARHGVYSSKGD